MGKLCVEIFMLVRLIAYGKAKITTHYKRHRANIYEFLEEPEACWKAGSYQNRMRYQNSLFPEMEGAYF
ncbi:MAG: hypothetical protein ACK5L5_12545 [Bacteroidales bacterium]